jgi:hypothetical protein
MESRREIPQKTKNRTTIGSRYKTPEHYPSKRKSGMVETLEHPRLMQCYSQYPFYGISPNAPQMKNALRKCGRYTWLNIIQP